MRDKTLSMKSYNKTCLVNETIIEDHVLSLLAIASKLFAIAWCFTTSRVDFHHS